MLAMIEKNTTNVLKKLGLSFTSIINQSMDLIKNPASLGIYVYLSSKPDGWIIQEKELMSRFDCGRDFIRARMKELKDIGLMETIAFRDKLGKITGWTTILHNQIPENPDSGNSVNQITEKPESGKTRRLENPTHINNIDIVIKEDYKSIVDSGSQNATSVNFNNYKTDKRFMRFYEAYPRRQKPRDAYKAFRQVVKDDDVLLNRIIEDINLRCTKHSQWQDKQYIPLPASYLRAHDFESEILNNGEEKAAKQAAKKENDKIKIEKLEEISRQKAGYKQALRLKEENSHLRSKPPIHFSNLIKNLRGN